MNPVFYFLIMLLLGIFVLPLINRRQFRNLPYDQQIRILMKEAKGAAYFKNVSKGSSGTLYFVKNRRKILELDWELRDSQMVCVKENPLEKWDYPEEHPTITDDEIKLLSEELEKFNKKSTVKFVL